MSDSPLSRIFGDPARRSGPPSGEAGKRLPWGLILTGVAVLFGLYVLDECWFVVPPTEMAGVTRLGVVAVSAPVGPGLHFKLPLIEHANLIQTSVSRFNLPQVQVYTADNQLLDLGISLTYQVPPAAVLHLLYGVGRAGNVDIDSTIEPIIADRALRVFAQHKTINVSARRAVIDRQMHVAISQALHRLFGIDVIDIQIRSIRYTSGFDQAVEEAVEAKAAAARAHNQVQQKRFEAEQTVATADGAAQARIARAKGQAAAVVLRAQAQAQAITIVARARAAAIAQVGAAAAANAAIIPYQVARRWNGQLPGTLVGSGGGGKMFRMLLPAPGAPPAK